MSCSEIVVLQDAAAVAETAAQRWMAAAEQAVAERGSFVVVLAGGSTPRPLYPRLAGSPYREQLPWSRTQVLFGDERCVPADHPQSNYRLARELLFDPVRVPSRNVHRMRGELDDPVAAAASYETVLRELFRGAPLPRFDLLLLGVGQDGHTASLFPGTAALRESSRWVVANHVPQLASWRLTLTLPALCAARRILFLVTGESKARVLAEAFGGSPHEPPYPCERVVPLDGQREVLADRAAASLLPRCG